MVKVSISFKNDKEVINKLDMLGKYLREAMRKALVPSAKALKRETLPRIRRRTGKTRSSYDYRVGKGMSAHVGSDWFVSRFLEKNYPALRPALESLREDISQFFIIEIEKAIIKASRT